MAYSFLDNLWESENSPAHAPGAGSGVPSAASALPPRPELMQSRSGADAGQVPAQAPPQMYGAGRPMESSGAPMPPQKQDPQAELKVLLRATVTQLYENHRSQQARQQTLHYTRDTLSAKLDYATNFLYAILALGIVAVACLVVLCYRSYRRN